MQKFGLTAFEPLGRSSTVPLLPSSTTTFFSDAPPLRVQPFASKLSADWPGASVYQFSSPTYRKGCFSTGSLHCDGEVISVLWDVPACAGTAPTKSAAAHAATAV